MSRLSICTFDQAPQGPAQAGSRPLPSGSLLQELSHPRAVAQQAGAVALPEGPPPSGSSSSDCAGLLPGQGLDTPCDLNPRAWSPSAEPGGALDLALPSAEGPCPASLTLSAPGLALSSLSSSPWTRWVRGQELC